MNKLNGLDLIENEDFNKLVENFIGNLPKMDLLRIIFDRGFVKVLEIVEESDDWREYEHLIFQLGNQHYSVRSQWGSTGDREYHWNTLKKVTPKTKEVVYYE